MWAGSAVHMDMSWLGGLACPGEISPSLKKLIKIQCVHMRSEQARLGEISLDFAEILPKQDENFPYEDAQAGHPGKAG